MYAGGGAGREAGGSAASAGLAQPIAGSQAGRPAGPCGTTRLQVAAEHVVHINHWPVRCQVRDLPAPLPLAVTEHWAHAVRCSGCRTRTRAAFPADQVVRDK